MQSIRIAGFLASHFPTREKKNSVEVEVKGANQIISRKREVPMCASRDTFPKGERLDIYGGYYHKHVRNPN